MSDFSDIAGDVAGIATEVFGDKVTYTPNGKPAVRLYASIGPTEVSLEDGTAVQLSYEHRDFNLIADQLMVSGEVYIPQRGDTITEVNGGKTYSYKVLPPDGFKECWTWADRFRIRRRIHCKLVGEQ